MSDLSRYPRQDAYETTLASEINSTATSIAVAEAPSGCKAFRIIGKV